MGSTRNIILCGFMGTGKSTIGRLVATRLGWQFVDTDALIEIRQGKPVADIFAQDGEPFFRQLESDLCAEMQTWERIVVATGGGMVLRPENRDLLLRAGVVICLNAPAEEIYRRIAQSGHRPLLQANDPLQRIRDLLAARADAYAALPIHLNTAGVQSSEVAATIISMWRSKVRKAERNAR
jgi:shikimate kinase